MMTLSLRPALAAAAILVLTATGAAWAQDISPSQRGEIERIVREYLLKNPELLQEAMAELEKKQTAAEA
jgi:hypothetical protein